MKTLIFLSLSFLISCMPNMNPSKLQFNVKSVGLPQISAEDSSAFKELKLNVLTPKCITCHTKWTNEAEFLKRHIRPGKPEKSKMYTEVLNGKMPKGGPALAEAEMDQIKNYINFVKTPDSPEFAAFKTQILEPNKCLQCHALMENEGNVLKYVRRGNAEGSKLLQVVLDGSMPKNNPALTTEHIEAMRDYINHLTRRTTAR